MNIFNKSYTQFYLYNRAQLWKWVNTHGSYGVVLFRLSKYVYSTTRLVFIFVDSLGSTSRFLPQTQFIVTPPQ